MLCVCGWCDTTVDLLLIAFEHVNQHGLLLYSVLSHPYLAIGGAMPSKIPGSAFSHPCS